MKMNITVRPSGSCIDPELLVKFVLTKCREVLAQNRKKLPPIWTALALAAVSPDQEFYTRLKEIISSSCVSPEEILGMFKNIFLPALDRLPNGQTPECSDSDDKYPPAQERDYKRVLIYAVREGQKMMDSRDYEFAKVFESLTWIGLQCYDFRLNQFECVRESFQDDPENLVKRGVEIIRDVLVSS